jgi:hypothetical protein
MSIKVCLALCIAGISTFSLAQDEQDIDKKMLAQCQALASQLNKSQGAGISLQEMTPLATWRAACAERPPTGPGNVTSLCEGKQAAAKGGKGVFFWQKSHQGKLNAGYFVCER